MWIVVVVAAAVAAADRPLVRADETPRAARYAKITPVAPARARNKGGGAYQAWVWRDGVVEHYQRFDRGKLVEARQFDGHGMPVATTTYTAGAPTAVTVHAGDTDAAFDVTAWTEARLPAAAPVVRLVLPGPGDPLGLDGVEAALPGGGELRVRIVPGPTPVGSNAFREGLADRCACLLVDRTSAFVDGRFGVRYLAERRDVYHPAIGELWAVSTGDATLLVSFFVPGVAPEDLGGWARATAAGRAVMTLARWEPR